MAIGSYQLSGCKCIYETNLRGLDLVTYLREISWSPRYLASRHRCIDVYSTYEVNYPSHIAKYLNTQPKYDCRLQQFPIAYYVPVKDQISMDVSR